jgi:hypothetical protein
MKAEKSNITDFNAEVDDMMTSLRAVDKGCDDIVPNLFEAYQLAGDSVFHQFIRELEVKWESGDIATLTPEELMQKAEGRFKVMVEKKVWAKPTKERRTSWPWLLLGLRPILRKWLLNLPGVARAKEPARGTASGSTHQ